MNYEYWSEHEILETLARFDAHHLRNGLPVTVTCKYKEKYHGHIFYRPGENDLSPFTIKAFGDVNVALPDGHVILMFSFGNLPGSFTWSHEL